MNYEDESKERNESIAFLTPSGLSYYETLIHYSDVRLDPYTILKNVNQKYKVLGAEDSFSKMTKEQIKITEFIYNSIAIIRADFIKVK